MSTIDPNATQSIFSTTPTATSAIGSKLKLQPADFLKMMITQLEHQDPMKPTTNSELLAQMSQIGQLQSSDSLQTSLQTFGLQTSISSASSMIGKTVEGLDQFNKPIAGVVTSVKVSSGSVALELDNGNNLDLASVRSISPGPAAATTTVHSATTTPVAAAT